MSRLIDADALRNAIILHRNTIHSDMNKRDEAAFRSGIRKALQCLEEAQTVDPIKHGHWVDGGDCDCQCSVCKSEWYSFDRPDDVEEWKFEARYCPKCGAKMDEVVDDVVP